MAQSFDSCDLCHEYCIISGFHDCLDVPSGASDRLTRSNDYACNLSGGRLLRVCNAIAMVLAPAAYMIAVELGQLNRVGPTVGPIRLGETFGILALLLGRGFHGLVGVLPIVAGVGMMIADLLAPPSPINIARVRRP